jgi:sec-independent protein translocase protein TatA
MSPLFLGNFGTGEIMLLGLIILVFFGGKKIPELMRGLGSGIREFNNAKNNIQTEVRDNIRELEEKEKVSK